MPAPPAHPRRRGRAARQAQPAASNNSNSAVGGVSSGGTATVAAAVSSAPAAAAHQATVTPPSATEQQQQRQNHLQYQQHQHAHPVIASRPTRQSISTDGAHLRSSAELFQEAQDSATELKALFVSQPPWTRESDTLRQRTRNAYLAVLFQHPLSPHAQSIDSLWLNTTYTLIAAYRDIVARIEAVIVPTSSTSGGTSRRNGGNGAGGSSSGGPKHMGGGGPEADLRRTLTRFRSALASEDSFYRSLISRIVGFYRLQDRTAEHLALVGLPVPPAGAENEPGLAPPLSREETEKKLSLVYKGLICLGDLERYKKQYSERARREAREALSQGLQRESRDRDSEDKYASAIAFYEVARGLQPDNGMAFNQLAVIDGYLGDNFHCTYHYFRALAVQQPFPGGEANLERVLRRVFNRWRRQRQGEADSGEEGSTTPHNDAGVFERDLLIILSILFVNPKACHIATRQGHLLELYSRLLKTRQLPSKTIVEVTAMVVGSHWYARLGPSTPSKQEAGQDPAKMAERRRYAEDLSLDFMLATFTTLLSVSVEELEETLQARATKEDSALDDEDESDMARGEGDGTLALAQNITAVVRRILPSLRILSRWLKCNLDYITRAGWSQNAELAQTITTFWTEYKRLMLGMARLFPLSQLPSLDHPLEEDIDMRGFLALRRGRGVEDHATADGLNDWSHLRQEVHPNEEQLMRIADLLVDVKLLMQTDAGAHLLHTGPPQPMYGDAPRNADDISVSISTDTEDDPVNMAMRATLTEGSSSAGDEQLDFTDDDEVIVWGRSTPVMNEPPPSHAPGPTAFDLLQTLSIHQQHGPAEMDPGLVSHPQGHGPQQTGTNMLFGGGDPFGGGSIWTMSREESKQGAERAAHVQPHHGHTQSNPSQNQGRPISAIWQDAPPGHHTMPSISSAWPQQAGPASRPPPPPGNVWPQMPVMPGPQVSHAPPPHGSHGPIGAASNSPRNQAPLPSVQAGSVSNIWGASERDTWGPPAGTYPTRSQWGMYSNP